MATALSGRIIDHAIVFGLPIKSKKLVQENWPFGFIGIGSVTPDSINYVCSYIQKKLYGKNAYCDNICPPFSLQSQGLGLRYALENKDVISNSDYLRYKGKPISIPRYFFKKLNLEKINPYIRLDPIAERLGYDTKLLSPYTQNLLFYAVYNDKRVLNSLHQVNRRLKGAMRKND